MKDLYKLYGLKAYINDESVIKNAIAYSTSKDKKSGEYVLLHNGRKTVYDRTHQNLKLIGMIRAELDLTETGHWDDRYSDFTYTKVKQRRRQSRATPPNSTVAKSSTAPDGYWSAGIIVVFLVMAIFWAVGSDSGRSAPTYKVKENSLLHVTSSALNVREQPNTKALIVGKLKRYQDVYEDKGKGKQNWSYIRAKGQALEGYVSNKYIAYGDGYSGYISDCRKKGVIRPTNGSILSRKATGMHKLVVNNSPGMDALIKLKNRSSKTVVAFYVRAGKSASVSVPEGSYQFQYATGSDYSNSCSRFLTNFHASKDPKFTKYKAKYSGKGVAYAVQTYTLKRVSYGNFSPSSMDISDF